MQRAADRVEVLTATVDSQQILLDTVTAKVYTAEQQYQYAKDLADKRGRQLAEAQINNYDLINKNSRLSALLFVETERKKGWRTAAIIAGLTAVGEAAALYFFTRF